MSKKSDLKKLLAKLDSLNTELDLDGSTQSFKQLIQEESQNLSNEVLYKNLTINFLNQLGTKLDQFKKDLNLKSVVKTIEAIQAEIEATKDAVAKDFTEVVQHFESKRKELEQSVKEASTLNRKEVTDLEKKVSSLQKEHRSLMEEKSSQTLKQLTEKYDRVLDELVDVVSKQETEQERFKNVMDVYSNKHQTSIKSVLTEIEDLRRSFLNRTSTGGSGNANRNIAINGNSSILSRYTDINFKNSSTIGWTATNNDVTKQLDIQASVLTGGGGYTNLTQFVDQTAWRVFYSDGSGDVTELALGSDGTFLKSNGATSAPTFATPAGSGDVTKVGTPVNNQIGVWTGDGTIEGDADLTFDTTTNTLATVTGTFSSIVTVADEAYGAGWNGSLEVPTKNAVYDQVELKENLSNKSTDTSLGSSNTLYPTQNAVKSYVDATAQGLSVKNSVLLATTAALPANIYSNGASGVGATLTGVATGVLAVDGVNVALNDRVLVKDEVTGANNGIYLCTVAGAVGVAYVLTRATDFDQPAEVPGAFTFVETGTTNVDSGWVCTTNPTVTIGTTSIDFTQFSGAGQITAGAALTKTGNTLDVAVDDSSIEVSGDALRVKALGVTNAMLAGSIAASKLVGTDIATVGTITSGTWNGTDIAVADGGTGSSTAPGAASNLGVGTGDSPQFTAVNIGHATDTTLTRVSAGVVAVEGINILLAGTKRYPILSNGNILPDTSGNVWLEPAALTQTNDRYPQMVARFKDTATKVSLGFRFQVPMDYVGGGKFYTNWTTTATSGNAIWDVDYSSATQTASLDPSADEESLTATTAAPGASQTGVVSSVVATAANFTAGDICQGALSRDGASSDTIAADLVVYDFYFEYTN